MAEVIKVVGRNAYVQVFESTRGMKVGAEAEFTGHMLEVTLGPGMLSKNYDGLQNDLDKMEEYSCVADSTLIRWIKTKNGILSPSRNPETRLGLPLGWARWRKTTSP